MDLNALSKAYESKDVEAKWYEFWLKHHYFHAADTSDRKPFCIVIPPPNVTGMLHMGHVLNNTIQDILARKARMDGKEVLWLPGTDHAGIATQVMVERQIKKTEHKTRHDLGRDPELNEAEISLALAVAREHRDVVSAIVVGNEVLLRHADAARALYDLFAARFDPVSPVLGIMPARCYSAAVRSWLAAIKTRFVC